jgi:hypothetical protein
MRVRNTSESSAGPSRLQRRSEQALGLRLRSATPRQAGRAGATLNCALVCLLFAASSHAASIHTESFDALSSSDLNGQDSWVADPTDAGQVQASVKYAGAKAVSITNDGSVASGATISRSFTVGATTNIVWTEWMARPRPMSRSTFLCNTNATALFYVNDSNKVVVFDGTTTNALSTTVTPDTWTRFTVRSDYSTKTWDLWVDRVSVATGLGFYNTGASGFTELGVSHGSTNGALAYVDELDVDGIVKQSSAADATLDFSETFESYQIGSLYGQSLWTVDDDDSVMVQADAVEAGTWAASIENQNGNTSFSTLSQGFNDSTATNVVWSDFYAQPVFATRATVVPDNDATTAFYVDDATDKLVVFDGTNRMVLSSKASLTSGAWTRFTVKADYDAKTWSVYVGGEPYADGLGFYNDTVSQLASFNVQEGSASGAAEVDTISITKTRPADIADLPEITIAAANPVTNHSATLNATLVATNGASTDVYVAYGTNDEGTVAANWDTNVLVSSAAGLGAATKPVAGLTASEGYVYRFFASNSVGVAWTDASNFTTEAATISIADATPVTEPDGAATIDATFAVTLSGVSASNVTATFNANSGTADEGVDFVDTNGTVTITAGATSADIVVVVSGDDAGEPNETFTVGLVSPVNAVITDGSGTGTINDNDEQPAANVLGGATSISGSEATANISVTSTGGAPAEAWVFWGTVDGTTYKPGENPGSDWDLGRYVGPVGVEDVTGVMTGLTANTLYYFRTYVSNTYTEVWSATRQFTTGPWELDFSETFETLLTGNIQGQRGWENSPNYLATVVSDGGAQSGSQYAVVTNSASRSFSTLSHDFDNTAAIDEVWSDFYAKPVFASRSNVVPNDDATTAFFVNSSGKVVVFDGTTKTTLSAKPSVTADTWTRFTVKADYTAKTWSLWVDKVEMETDLGFYNNGITQFATFAVDEGSASGLATLDSIEITTSMPSDLLEATGTLFKFR